MEQQQQNTNISKAARVMEVLKQRPGITAAEVAKEFGTTKQYVYSLKSRKMHSQMNTAKKRGRPAKNTITTAIIEVPRRDAASLQREINELRLEMMLMENSIKILKGMLRGASV